MTAFTLNNGLRVVHRYDSTPTLAAVNILYNVGARDEDPSLTGLAHLFEHLMFGGSANVADFDYELELAGGTSNAWTSNDFTNFYDLIPASNIETAFWIESDRMLSLNFDSRTLEAQKGVVTEEFQQTCLNKPYGDTAHHLRGLLYHTHPYRFPTIGASPEHIRRVTSDDVRDFFFSHYAPNNAVLAVAGPVTAERVRALAEKWFGSIPRRDVAPRLYLPEEPITEPRRKTVVAKVPQTRITIAWPMDAYGHPDYPATDLITDILASGQSARFNTRLVMGTNLFTAADASIAGSMEPGFLMLTAALRDNSDRTLHEAEKALLDQAYELAMHGPSEKELRRAFNRFESNTIFSRIGCAAMARELAREAMTGDDCAAVMEQYRRVTTGDIVRVAQRIFNPRSSCTLIYRPE